MDDEPALIARPRDYSDIIKLQEPGSLEDFFNEPLPFIVATVTGALAAGKPGWILSSGRLVQAMLKGRLFEQWSREVKRFQEAGRIPDNFADKKYGFQTWVELMTIIDEESPDVDRLEVLKAMFFAVNKVGTNDGEKIKAYQLWRIAKILNSGEFLLLKAVYEHRGEYQSKRDSNRYSTWLSFIAEAISHGSEGLVALHEKKPTELGLLTVSVATGTGLYVTPTNARMSQLGLMFCANIENYEIEVRELERAE
jgi:hypothetical protein